MKFEKTDIFNFEGAFRGMRNPLNSHDKADTLFDYGWPVDGKNDLKLAQSLILAGTDHSKFMRQIMVSVDITAPLYWWKEFDTYKVGTVANSTSTMHKLATTEITKNCFELDDEIGYLRVDGYHDNCTYSLSETIIPELINTLESLRIQYLETKDKRYWRALIQLLPSSWLQTRTVTMSYQNIRAMYFARKNHKLICWSKYFVDWIKTLPYANELLFLEDK